MSTTRSKKHTRIQPQPKPDSVQRLLNRSQAAAADAAGAGFTRTPPPGPADAAGPSSVVAERKRTQDTPRELAGTNSQSAQVAAGGSEARPDAEDAPAEPSSVPKTRSSARRRPVVLPDSGPRGRLDLDGSNPVKYTLLVPASLRDRLAAWECRETERTGKRVLRERVIDQAFARMPRELDAVLERIAALPVEYLDEELDTMGTRIRPGVSSWLQVTRARLKQRRGSTAYLWQLATAALHEYLEALEAAEEDHAPTQ